MIFSRCHKVFLRTY